jgi:hypothetical protein
VRTLLLTSVAVGLLALALAAAGAFALWRAVLRPGPADLIGPQVCSRIRSGMTEARVVAAVGIPPGDYYTGLRDKVGPLGLDPQGWGIQALDHPGITERRWWGNSYLLEVDFGADGKVVGCFLWKVYSSRNLPAIDRE